MLDIRIRTVAHSDQRYDTVGDWQWDRDRLTITISGLGSTYKELLVAVHELIEVYLCRIRGITQEEVDKFDIEYENNRRLDDTTSEPGDSLDAPYRKEHRFAENIERQICHEMGINWDEYEATVYNL